MIHMFSQAGNRSCFYKTERAFHQLILPIYLTTERADKQESQNGWSEATPFYPKNSNGEPISKTQQPSGLVLPLQMLPAVVLLETGATAGCGSTTRDTGHPVTVALLGSQSTPVHGSPCSWYSFSSRPSGMAGRKQSGGSIPGNAPRAAAVRNSSSCFPFFSFHEGGRNDGDHLAQFPLRHKSGLKATKGRV